MSRQTVRAVVAGWLDPSPAALWAASNVPPPDGLDKVHTSFPKRIDFKAYARIPNVATRCQAVVFIKHQSQARASIGGDHLGWKVKTYDVVLQCFAESKQRDSETAMTDCDVIADAIEARILADHRFGQASTVIFRAAEPALDLSWGEPFLNAAGVTEQWFQFMFSVEQWSQA